MMPMHTITNASSVPMLGMCPSFEIGRKPEKSETKTMKIRLQRQGVRNFAWTSENTLGSSPSRDIEKNTRDCPSSIDRKSTRLNSSHLVISYAVFCLKKKHKRNS